MNRKDHLRRIHTQLKYWQDNLATRVAGEAQALAKEVGKLRDPEYDETWQLIQTAHDQILAATDILRDVRRRLQDRQEGT